MKILNIIRKDISKLNNEMVEDFLYKSKALQKPKVKKALTDSNVNDLLMKALPAGTKRANPDGSIRQKQADGSWKVISAEKKPKGEPKKEKKKEVKTVDQHISNKKNVGDVISFLDARNTGDVTEAKKLRDKLKEKFGNKFNEVLNNFGDPDDPNGPGYMGIRNQWLAKLQELGG